MTVDSVVVNGRPATFKFVQPTYPGDPNGQDDPDPLAHQASQVNPVGGPTTTRCRPPARRRSPGRLNAQNGDPCPANKLVITPSAPDPGRHDVHGHGRLHRPARRAHRRRRHDRRLVPQRHAAGDGGFVTTEPVGTEDWMPLNDHPTAKPTYDFYDTVNTGKTAIANGELLSTRRTTRRTRTSRTARRPGIGTRRRRSRATWSRTASATIRPDLAGRRATASATTRRKASAIDAGAEASQPRDHGPAAGHHRLPEPASTDRSRSRPTASWSASRSAGFEEEMQTMITFAGGQIDLDTFYHENMHQWWGDNVTEANFN